MAAPIPLLDAAGVNALLRKAFPGATPEAFPTVVEVAPGRVKVMAAYREDQLRPGGVISGPTLMSLSDTAAYALVLAHIGDQLMAVNSSLTSNFLRGARPGHIHAQAEMLRHSPRLGFARPGDARRAHPLRSGTPANSIPARPC